MSSSGKYVSLFTTLNDLDQALTDHLFKICKTEFQLYWF